MKPSDPFPIQAERHAKSGTIPWWLAMAAYDYYTRKHGKSQTLERLAKRGGFGRTELIRLLRREDS